MNKKITKVVKPKSKTEKLIESTLLRAKSIKATAEESMRRELLESFSPMMKKSISNHLSEMEDFEMQDDDELQEESVEEVEEMEDFEMNEEEEETETGAESEEFAEEGAEEVGSEEFAEEGSDEETLEEEATEGEDAEFLAELERLLSEETDSNYQEEDELNESEEGAEEDELNESEEGAEEDELNESEEGAEEEEEMNESENSGELSHSFRGAMKESKDGGVYTGKGGKADPYNGKESDKNAVYTLKAENKRLKEALQAVSRDFNETVMDTKRLKEYKKLVSKYSLSEAMKLKVMRNVDSAKNDKELKLVVETIENTIRKNSKRPSNSLSENVTRKRNTAGKASSMRPVVGGKKLQESKNAGNVIDTDLINQWAHWADIPSKN